MKLTESKINQNVILVNVNLPEDKQIQLAEIGLSVGCNICPLLKIGSNTVIRYDGCCLILGDEITNYMDVEYE